MRIDRVLVPIDFSPVSTVALNCAITSARRFRASLTLLHVLERHDRDADQVSLKLSGLVAPEDQDDLNMQTLTMQGKAQDQILASIRDGHPDLVVMGSGSTTLGVLRHSNVPIMTVNAASRCLGFHRFLYVTDLSDASVVALQSVLDLVKTTERNVSIESVLSEDLPAKTILKTAEEKGADIIVISIAHEGLLERAFHRSTTESVIRKSKVPVLSIPKRVRTDVGQRAA